MPLHRGRPVLAASFISNPTRAYLHQLNAQVETLASSGDTIVSITQSLSRRRPSPRSTVTPSYLIHLNESAAF